MFNALLAQATPPAQPMQQDDRARMLSTVFMLGVMIFLFYFLAIRPQSKKAKEHAAMLKTVKPGDKVVTASGIVGIVVAVKERTISLRSAETKLEVLKSAITEISERDGESNESKPNAS